MSKLFLSFFCTVALGTAACSSGGGSSVKGKPCPRTLNPLTLDVQNVEKLALEKTDADAKVPGLPDGTFIFNGADYRFSDTKGDNDGTRETRRNNVIAQLKVSAHKSSEKSEKFDEFHTTTTCVRGMRPNVEVEFPKAGAMTRIEVPKGDPGSDKFFVNGRIFSGKFDGNKIVRAFDADMDSQEVSAPKEVLENPDDSGLYKATEYTFFKHKGNLAVGQSRFELRTKYDLGNGKEIHVTSYFRLCTEVSQELKDSGDQKKIDAEQKIYEECLKELPFEEDKTETEAEE